MDLRRIFRHSFAPDWLVYRAFPHAALKRMETAVRKSESLHGGELRIAVEAGLDFLPLLRGVTPRSRAREAFSLLRVWDTEENSGVLIYLQLVDRRIEVVADRGISTKVEQATWDAICRRMEGAFRDGRFEQGVLEGVREITALLVRHFPVRGANPDELPDQPTVL
ncbi:MAG: TPM domain-containing protein [Burkholderiales bacterium]